MSAEINSIINNLCEKLGTSVQYLIPELAKLKTAEALSITIILFLATCILACLIPKSNKFSHDNDYEWEWVIVLHLILLIASTIAFFISVPNLAGWLVSPTGKAVLEITHMIK